MKLLSILQLFVLLVAVSSVASRRNKAEIKALDSSQLSSTGYIEYIPGELNVILSVPHGGSKRPSSILNRIAGGLVNGTCVYNHDIEKDVENCAVKKFKDLYTKELALMVADNLMSETGKYPHVVINHLHRKKMDANREINEAAFGVPSAMQAWTEFHAFIDVAKNNISGGGLLFDIHGQTHPEQWIEVGYDISIGALDSGTFTWDHSSIKHLAEVNGLITTEDFNGLIRGNNSFGGLLQAYGYKAIPSPENPSPNGGKYFDGGYITETHGSEQGGITDAIQIESPKELRNQTTGPPYAADLAKVIQEYRLLYL